MDKLTFFKRCSFAWKQVSGNKKRLWVQLLFGLLKFWLLMMALTAIGSFFKGGFVHAEQVNTVLVYFKPILFYLCFFNVYMEAFKLLRKDDSKSKFKWLPSGRLTLLISVAVAALAVVFIFVKTDALMHPPQWFGLSVLLLGGLVAQIYFCYVEFAAMNIIDTDDGFLVSLSKGLNLLKENLGYLLFRMAFYFIVIGVMVSLLPIIMISLGVLVAGGFSPLAILIVALGIVLAVWLAPFLYLIAAATYLDSTTGLPSLESDEQTEE